MTAMPAHPHAGQGGHLSASLLAQSQHRTLIMVAAAVFGLLLIIGLLAVSALTTSGRKRRLTSQLERYGPRHAPTAQDQRATESRAATAALGWATTLLRSSNTERGLAERLDRAGIIRRPAEWVLLGAIAGLVFAAAFSLLTRSALLGIPCGVLGSWITLRVVLSIRISRRQAAFSQQLPDALQFISGSLRSGFSLQQSIDGVIRETGQPGASELTRALAEVRIGVDIDAALETVANRMNSDDLRWTVMAIRIHREVGGNLAEVLDNTAATMREREFLRRHVRGLSAEGRLSAYVLIALPILIGGFLLVTDSKYMKPLFTTGIGLAMVAGGSVLFVLGTVWMRKLVKVEV